MQQFTCGDVKVSHSPKTVLLNIMFPNTIAILNTELGIFCMYLPRADQIKTSNKMNTLSMITVFVTY